MPIYDLKNYNKKILFFFAALLTHAELIFQKERNKEKKNKNYMNRLNNIIFLRLKNSNKLQTKIGHLYKQ